MDIGIGFGIGSTGGVGVSSVQNFNVVLVDVDGVDTVIDPNTGLAISSTYAHITWTASAKYEIEIWRSLDGAAFALLTTLGLSVAEYDDQLFDGNTHTVEYYGRFKEDLTVLNIPTGLTLAAIAGGIRITWDDNNTEADNFEIAASVDSGDYALVTTVNDGVETYDHTVAFSVDVKYKIRAKEGTLPIYSGYSEVSTITLSSIVLAILNDGNTFGWYDASDLSTITKDGGDLVSSWRDKLGSGNDLVQATGTNQPLWASTGITFDGTDNKISTGAKALDQPVMVYFSHKQITWTNTDVLFSGHTEAAFYQQYASTPATRIYAGTSVTSTGTLAAYKIDRVMFNGANSYVRENAGAKSSGNAGTVAFGGFKLAERLGYYGNIEVKETIVRKVADTDATTDLIYRYLKQKNSI